MILFQCTFGILYKFYVIVLCQIVCITFFSSLQTNTWQEAPWWRRVFSLTHSPEDFSLIWWRGQGNMWLGSWYKQVVRVESCFSDSFLQFSLFSLGPQSLRQDHLSSGLVICLCLLLHLQVFYPWFFPPLTVFRYFSKVFDDFKLIFGNTVQYGYGFVL